MSINNDWFYNSAEFQEFFRHSSQSAVIKANASHFTIIAVSDGYLHMTHRKREDLLGKDFFDIFPGNAIMTAQKEVLLKSFERVIETGETDVLPVYEYQIFLPDAKEYKTQYWSNKNEPVRGEAGDIRYIIRTVINLTDKVTVEQLAAEEEKLRLSLHREQSLNEELASSVEELRAVNDELHISQNDLFALTSELEGRVSERTREIKDNENRFRSLVEQLPVATNVFLTQDLVVDLPNKRMLEIWGRTFDEVNGKPLGVGMPELEGQPFMQKLRDVITTGIPYISNEEKATIRRNGQLENLYFNIVYQPITNGDGTITSCLQIASDVTEEVLSRQKIQTLNEELAAMNEELTSANEEQTAINEELQQAQNDYIEVYNQLLKNREDLLFTIDSATLATFDLNPVTGRFTGNHLLKEWFGLQPEEEIELQKATDVIAESDRPRVIAAINESLRFESGGGYNVEYSIANPDNLKVRNVRAKGRTRFDEKGHPVQLSGILLDITEQKRDDQRKNDFIGMVSHEMKTPLTSLSGYLQLLRTREGVDAFAENMLDKANKQINRITTLINGFLNVTRLESGQIHIEKKRFDMAELVKEAEDEAKTTINSHRVVFAPVRETWVNADRDKITQVISNLISNAVKYSPADTVINVACITVGSSAIVSIKDEGIGIKEEDQAKLFDRFYRVSNDTSSPSGFGIGLYLCAEIIQRHDGKIWVDSTVSKGSTFSFSLPVINND